MHSDEIYSQIPLKIREFWEKNLKENEKLHGEYGEEDPRERNRFTIFKSKMKGPADFGDRIYLARGAWLNRRKVEIQYLHEKKYYSEKEFLSLLALKAFW